MCWIATDVRPAGWKQIEDLRSCSLIMVSGSLRTRCLDEHMQSRRPRCESVGEWIGAGYDVTVAGRRANPVHAGAGISTVNTLRMLQMACGMETAGVLIIKGAFDAGVGGTSLPGECRISLPAKGR
jgi:hypothetical protein